MTSEKETITKIKEELNKTVKDAFPVDKNFGRPIKDYTNEGLDFTSMLTFWQNLCDKGTVVNDEAYEWQPINAEPFIAMRTNKDNPHKFDLLKKDNSIYIGCYPVSVSDGIYNDGIASATFTLSTKNTVEDFALTVEIDGE